MKVKMRSKFHQHFYQKLSKIKSWPLCLKPDIVFFLFPFFIKVFYFYFRIQICQCWLWKSFKNLCVDFFVYKMLALDIQFLTSRTILYSTHIIMQNETAAHISNIYHSFLKHMYQSFPYENHCKCYKRLA